MIKTDLTKYIANTIRKELLPDIINIYVSGAPHQQVGVTHNDSVAPGIDSLVFASRPVSDVRLIEANTTLLFLADLLSTIKSNDVLRPSHDGIIIKAMTVFAQNLIQYYINRPVQIPGHLDAIKIFGKINERVLTAAPQILRPSITDEATARATFASSIKSIEMYHYCKKTDDTCETLKEALADVSSEGFEYIRKRDEALRSAFITCKEAEETTRGHADADGTNTFEFSPGSSDHNVNAVDSIHDHIVKDYLSLRTGYPVIDRAAAVESSSLSLISGPSNHCKSIFLINICKRVLELNKDTFNRHTEESGLKSAVLFVTLEDDIYKLTRRIESIFGNFSPKYIKELYNRSNKLALLDKSTNGGNAVGSKVSDLVKSTVDMLLAGSVLSIVSDSASFIIRHGSENTFCANDLELMMGSLLERGILVDMVALDYIDVMSCNDYMSSNDDEYTTQGKIMHELRVLTRAKQIPLISISQNSRSSEDARTVLSNANIGDSYKKVRYSENIIMIRQRNNEPIDWENVFKHQIHAIVPGSDPKDLIPSGSIKPRDPMLTNQHGDTVYDTNGSIVVPKVHGTVSALHKEYIMQKYQYNEASDLVGLEIKATKSKEGEKDLSALYIFNKSNIRIYNDWADLYEDSNGGAIADIRCTSALRRLDIVADQVRVDAIVRLEKNHTLATGEINISKAYMSERCAILKAYNTYISRINRSLTPRTRIGLESPMVGMDELKPAYDIDYSAKIVKTHVARGEAKGIFNMMAELGGCGLTHTDVSVLQQRAIKDLMSEGFDVTPLDVFGDVFNLDVGAFQGEGLYMDLSMDPELARLQAFFQRNAKVSKQVLPVNHSIATPMSISNFMESVPEAATSDDILKRAFEAEIEYKIVANNNVVELYKQRYINNPNHFDASDITKLSILDIDPSSQSRSIVIFSKIQSQLDKFVRETYPDLQNQVLVLDPAEPKPPGWDKLTDEVQRTILDQAHQLLMAVAVAKSEMIVNLTEELFIQYRVAGLDEDIGQAPYKQLMPTDLVSILDNYDSKDTISDVKSGAWGDLSSLGSQIRYESAKLAVWTDLSHPDHAKLTMTVNPETKEVTMNPLPEHVLNKINANPITRAEQDKIYVNGSSVLTLNQNESYGIRYNPSPNIIDTATTILKDSVCYDEELSTPEGTHKILTSIVRELDEMQAFETRLVLSHLGVDINQFKTDISVPDIYRRHILNRDTPASMMNRMVEGCSDAYQSMPLVYNELGQPVLDELYTRSYIATSKHPGVQYDAGIDDLGLEHVGERMYVPYEDLAHKPNLTMLDRHDRHIKMSNGYSFKWDKAPMAHELKFNIKSADLRKAFDDTLTRAVYEEIPVYKPLDITKPLHADSSSLPGAVKVVKDSLGRTQSTIDNSPEAQYYISKVLPTSHEVKSKYKETTSEEIDMNLANANTPGVQAQVTSDLPTLHTKEYVREQALYNYTGGLNRTDPISPVHPKDREIPPTNFAIGSTALVEGKSGVALPVNVADVANQTINSFDDDGMIDYYRRCYPDEYMVELAKASMYRIGERSKETNIKIHVSHKARVKAAEFSLQYGEFMRESNRTMMNLIATSNLSQQELINIDANM